MPVLSHHLLRVLEGNKEVPVEEEAKVEPHDEPAYEAALASYGDQEAEQKLVQRGYTVDPELSNANEKVFVSDKDVLIGYRGTQDARDLYDDINLAFGRRTSPGFRKSHRTAEKAKKKYNRELVHAGHSLGGTKALEAQKRLGGRTVAFNPGQSILGERTDQKVYVNSNDIVANRIRGSNLKVTKKRKGLLNAHALKQFK
jgi:hypothetical protein